MAEIYSVTYCNDTLAFEFLTPHKFILHESIDKVAPYSTSRRLYKFKNLKPSCIPIEFPPSFLTTTKTTTTTASLLPYSSSSAISNIDRFTDTLIYQHKQTTIISILFILFLLLILIFSLRKILHIIPRHTSIGSLFNSSIMGLQTKRQLDQNIEDVEIKQFVEKHNDNAIEEMEKTTTIVNCDSYDPIP